MCSGKHQGTLPKKNIKALHICFKNKEIRTSQFIHIWIFLIEVDKNLIDFLESQKYYTHTLENVDHVRKCDKSDSGCISIST